MVTIPNIYARKDLRPFVIFPIVLLVIGVLLSTQLVLDSTLAGGVSMTLQTNASVSASALSSELSSVLHVQAPSVTTSAGQVAITFSTNQSLGSAEKYLLQFYAYSANYSTDLVSATTFSIDLQQNAKNATALAGLKKANAGINSSIAQMQGAVSNELAAVSPFVSGYSITGLNTSLELQTVAQAAYNNASNAYEQRVIAGLRTLVPFSSYSYEAVSPTLGSFFLSQFVDVIIFAFILVFIVVFIIFRSPVPSAVVVFGAANDMIIALGVMGLFKIPLGVASIAGLLMIIGYAMDTDVLTAIRILRRHEGSPEERAYGSMRTGLTMTSTAIVAFAVLFVVSVIVYIPTYYEVSAVVLAGLIGDIITTWFGNASILLMYKRRKERRL